MTPSAAADCQRPLARGRVRALLLRRPELAWLAAWGLAILARLRSRPVGIIVVLHGVEERWGECCSAREFELAPVLARAELEPQLAFYRRHFAIVRLDQLKGAMERRSRWGRIPLAITLDDDLSSHLSLVVPALRRAGLTATFFLGGDENALRQAYWWEPLQLALDLGIALPATGGIARTGRDPAHLAEAMLSLSSGERSAITADLWDRVGDCRTVGHLAHAEIAAVSRAGQCVGFHTLAHEPLPGLADAALARALTAGRAELARVSGQPVDAIAYPHGSVDDRVAAAASAAGFRLGVTTEPRPVTPQGDPMRMGRVDVSIGPAGLLALRVARALHRD